MTVQHPHDFIEDSNTSNNPHFENIVQKTVSRRGVLQGGIGLMALSAFGGLSLTAHSTPITHTSTTSPASLAKLKTLKFTPVPHYTGTEMVVAEGYEAKAFLHLGEPLIDGVEPFAEHRKHSGESFRHRMGDNHDGMWFFGMTNNKYDPNASKMGLLAMNHEYTNHNLHPMGFYTQDDTQADEIFRKRRLGIDVRRDANAHGISVSQLRKLPQGGYELVKNARFNKRHTSTSHATIKGKAAGHPLMHTKFDPTGRKTWGINNQCGAGLSPWGTFLSTEENFLNVFARGDDKAIRTSHDDKALTRYGLKANSVGGGYLWHTPDVSEATEADEFARWDATASKNANEDYQNGFNTFGYIVEVDPFNPDALPVKRTSLGRFAHENCAFAPPVAGKPLVFYMGDDARGEYIYKFVSEALWSDSDIGKGCQQAINIWTKASCMWRSFMMMAQASGESLAMG